MPLPRQPLQQRHLGWPILPLGTSVTRLCGLRPLERKKGSGQTPRLMADDYRLGELTRREGVRTVLSEVVVETVVSEITFSQLVRHELRRLSIAEPILQDEAFYATALRRRVEDKSHPVDRFLTLLHRWKAAQLPDTEEACAQSPIANYSERDLLTEQAGK